MKKVIGVMVALLLAITLLPACGPSVPPASPSPSPSPTPSEEGGAPSSYTGFMTPAAGQWVEYDIPTDGEVSRQKMEYIGQDTVDGKTCTGFEMTMTVSGQGETIVQIWTDVATQQAVKYVMKMQGQVLCLDLSQSPQPPQTGTPGQYDPNLTNISYGTYTTPTQKTVDVAKFAVGGGEGWVSSQVPFGMVKAIDASGKTIMSLYDFGTSGARRDISEQEMENCMQMPG
jgi:hypothetical protein